MELIIIRKIPHILIRKYFERLSINIVDKMAFYCKFKRSFFFHTSLFLLSRLRIITANMNNVIVGELICALWENWRMQRQIRINTISQHTDQPKAKVFDDHDSNLSISEPSKALTSNIHDDRYMLLSPRS